MLVVVVVVDGHPDVVEDRGRPQQLALVERRPGAARPAPARRRARGRGRRRGRRVARRRRTGRRGCGPRRRGRRRTAGGRPARGGRPGRSPSRSPASVASTRCDARRLHDRARRTAAPARMRSPRWGLIPGTVPRSLRGQRGEVVDQLVERRPASIGWPWTPKAGEPGAPLQGGGEIAHRARRSRRGGHRNLRASRSSASVASTWSRSRRSAFFDAVSPGEEVLGHPHRAQRPGAAAARPCAGSRARAGRCRRRGRARARRSAWSSCRRRGSRSAPPPRG